MITRQPTYTWSRGAITEPSATPCAGSANTTLGATAAAAGTVRLGVLRSIGRVGTGNANSIKAHVSPVVTPFSQRSHRNAYGDRAAGPQSWRPAQQ